MKEKRRAHREKMVAEVFYKDEQHHSFGGCVSKDVSTGGVCVKIERFMPVGTVLDLEFKLPLSQVAFYVKGTVMWIAKMPLNDQWEVGLKITMDPKYHQLVEDYIDVKKTGTPLTSI